MIKTGFSEGICCDYNGLTLRDVHRSKYQCWWLVRLENILPRQSTSLLKTSMLYVNLTYGKH